MQTRFSNFKRRLNEQITCTSRVTRKPPSQSIRAYCTSWPIYETRLKNSSGSRDRSRATSSFNDSHKKYAIAPVDRRRYRFSTMARDLHETCSKERNLSCAGRSVSPWPMLRSTMTEGACEVTRWQGWAVSVVVHRASVSSRSLAGRTRKEQAAAAGSTGSRMHWGSHAGR